jgi:putative ABC transport system ATP-binding protein
MNPIAIECKGVKKSYGKNETRIDALKGIDLTIDSGLLTLLVGPSGSGKTTLLSIITTILTPDEGQLLLLGKDINRMSENEKAEFCLKNLGVVFQSLFLIPTLTVEENISLPLLIAGETLSQANAKSMEILVKMNLAHRSASAPSDLSKGQQQRIAIARAIVNDAKIIVCDEPTSSLDHVVGNEIMTILHNLAKTSSKAVLVVTHDHRIFPFADRIINMCDGEIILGEDHV